MQLARHGGLMPFRALFVSIVAFSLISCDPNDTVQDAPPDLSAHSRFIVKMKPEVGLFSIGDKAGYLLSKAGTENRVEAIDEEFFTLELTTDKAAALEALAQSPNVAYIEPDPVAYALHRPNDPMWTSQWAHLKIQSEQAWDLSRGSETVVVAVIDTGIDYNHPDLRANVWTNAGETPNNGRDDDGNGLVDDYYGYDFANNDGDPMADDVGSYHGTHVSGTIGAVGDNGIGVTGHAPRVKLMGLKFLAGNGQGQVSNAIRAINYAISKRVKIMSNSWGSGQGSQALADAISRARQAGILFVAAAGNGGQDGIGDNNDS
ncbi:MAG TPA: S8 family peptidase, partial [Bdellovibrionales bacterium]|nr:S8 family peptidase [Bdellovibrionales bacterium]